MPNAFRHSSESRNPESPRQRAFILSCICNRAQVDIGLARQSSYFPLLVQRKVTKVKDTPLSLISFASAPHPGRLAQRALADYTERSLLRSLNGSRRLTRIPARCKGATEGKDNNSLCFVIPYKRSTIRNPEVPEKTGYRLSPV